MTKYVPWTLTVIFGGLMILGAVALAQWEPPVRERRIEWVTPTPITEGDLLQDVALQELCYLVQTDYNGGHLVTMWTVREHKGSVKDRWFLPPIVVRQERRNVWEKLVEAFNRGERQ